MTLVICGSIDAAEAWTEQITSPIYGSINTEDSQANTYLVEINHNMDKGDY